MTFSGPRTRPILPPFYVPLDVHCPELRPDGGFCLSLSARLAGRQNTLHVRLAWILIRRFEPRVFIPVSKNWLIFDPALVSMAEEKYFIIYETYCTKIAIGLNPTVQGTPSSLSVQGSELGAYSLKWNKLNTVLQEKWREATLLRKSCLLNVCAR